MRFRKLVFWLHLIAGIVAGAVILIMSATGVVLAFEKEIIAWAERDVRRVTAPAGVQPLGLDELLKRLREEHSGGPPSAITLNSSANVAVLVSLGRTNTFYIDPYTGVVSNQGATGVRKFMQTMIQWHRYLGGDSERRALGKAVTGACNAVFLFLAASGLYLWWPRQWTKAALRAVGWMDFKLRSRARDWNWHNAVGLWCAPVLIVLTATALPISYQWAGSLIYKLTGSTPPPPRGGPGGGTPAVEIPAPPPDAKPLGMEALFTATQKEFPQWKQISYRGGGSGGRGGRGESSRSSGGMTTNSPPSDPGGGENRERRERSGPQAVTLAVVEQGQWPLFATTQVTLDPFTGVVLHKEGFSDYNLGRQVRSWTRFLHTGEALGIAGKAVACAASAGGVLLVWTGIALAWRRFFIRKGKA